MTSFVAKKVAIGVKGPPPVIITKSGSVTKLPPLSAPAQLGSQPASQPASAPAQPTTTTHPTVLPLTLPASQALPQASRTPKTPMQHHPPKSARITPSKALLEESWIEYECRMFKEDVRDLPTAHNYIVYILSLPPTLESRIKLMVVYDLYLQLSNNQMDGLMLCAINKYLLNVRLN